MAEHMKYVAFGGELNAEVELFTNSSLLSILAFY